MVLARTWSWRRRQGRRGDVCRGEEIEETSEDSTEIVRQRERETTRVAGLERPSVDRPVDRRRNRSTRLSIGVHDVHRISSVDRPVDRLKARLLSVGSGRPGGRPWTRVGRPASRPTDACWLSFLDSDSFSGWDRIQLGFLKPWDSVAINKG